MQNVCPSVLCTLSYQVSEYSALFFMVQMPLRLQRGTVQPRKFCPIANINRVYLRNKYKLVSMKGPIWSQFQSFLPHWHIIQVDTGALASREAIMRICKLLTTQWDKLFWTSSYHITKKGILFLLYLFILPQSVQNSSIYILIWYNWASSLYWFPLFTASTTVC